MQRIYINEDDKLVIETDNGKLVGNETSTKIEETFEVDSLDVMKIKHLVDGSKFKTCTIYIEDEYGYGNTKYHGYLVDKKEGDIFNEELNTRDEKIRDLIKEKAELKNEINSIKNTLNNECSNSNSLGDKIINIINKIKEHNSHWYNRKIKI